MKILTAHQKREAVEFICEATGLSQRRACLLTDLSLSTCHTEGICTGDRARRSRKRCAAIAATYSVRITRIMINNVI